MTRDNATAVLACLSEDGERAVARIVEISTEGRAPKNDPAIFALALASAHETLSTRRAALAALPHVCRIGTHLFQFAESASSLRRWGRGLRKAIGDWYNGQPADRLAVQLAKYRQREGWSHRDLLRLAHPSGVTPQHNAMFRWAAGSNDSSALLNPTLRGASPAPEHLPPYLYAFEQLQRATSLGEVVELIQKYSFTHEMLPTEWKNHVEVWDALLRDMPQTALIRNLGKMTQIGLLKEGSEAARLAAAKITDKQRLQQSRMHPLTLLNALRIYGRGYGEKGSLRWQAVKSICDAIDAAFYESFKNIRPSNKKHMLALDVSGSMVGGSLAGLPGIDPRTGSAAMAMVTARTEPESHFVGFSSELVPLKISRGEPLTKVIEKVNMIPMGATDCAQPMLYAQKHKIEVDTFVVYTDNETWFGAVHPFVALKRYREAMGRPAKLIVVGMTATNFTIADPSDAGMLDVVGFDSAAPAVMADFSAA